MRPKHYLALVISLILITVPLFIGQYATHKTKNAFKEMTQQQLKLSDAAHNLKLAIKRHQALMIESIVLIYHNNSASTAMARAEHSRNEIEKELIDINRYANLGNDKTIYEVAERLNRRIYGFQSVENSIMEALKAGDKTDIEDAMIGYDMVSEKLSSDAEELTDIVAISLEKTANRLNETYNYSNTATLLAIIFALITLLFTFLRLLRLNKKNLLLLDKAREATEKERELAKQLEAYSDNLKAEVEAKTKELHDRYYYNMLTTLPNRNRLLEDIKERQHYNVALFNLDKFQEFNDFFGEALGNEALRSVAEFFKTTMDSSFFIYHLGSDEFVLINRNIHLKEEFIAVITETLERFNKHKFFQNDEPYYLTSSVGIAVTTTKHLASADIALKEAKRRHNGIFVYDETTNKELEYEANLHCSKQLIHALHEHRIKPYFQPIAHTADRKIAKYEALARIIDPEGNPIPPIRFIQLSKQIHVYNRLTRAIFYATLETIKSYQVACSFNISVDDINDPHTVAMFTQALDTFEHNDLLSIELLETEAVLDYATISAFIATMRGYGVKIAIDDFGSGYSNFTRMLKLHVDYIKIDASLISQIDKESDSRIMVEAIVELTRKFGIKTIAEFVSSEAIYETLKTVGVDYVQGFYIAKPAPIETFFTQED